MTSTDPISDMLTRMRNAIAVRKDAVVMPHSKVKESVAKVLKSNGYIVDFSVEADGPGKNLTLVLKTETINSPITEIKRLSTPGRRSYTSADKIPYVKQGRGMVIISTSQGVVTGDEARKNHIGGELICEVY